MLRFKGSKKGEKGFTLIELLVVAAIIGILLAIAIPNLLKARVSANEASARKMMQTLRDAEGEYFEQDLDGNNARDYTNKIGKLGDTKALRDPSGTGKEEDALIDSSFENAVQGDGQGGVASGTSVDTTRTPKAGYVVAFDSAVTDTSVDFGWMTSMVSAQKVGRRDFAVYGDGAIRCTISSQTSGNAGKYEASRTSGGCS
jgi:prepilin-type N-terminal cleavage/methylation domain-containing protein